MPRTKTATKCERTTKRTQTGKLLEPTLAEMRDLCLSRQVPVKKIGVGKEEKRLEDGSDVSVSLNSDDTSDETTISSDNRKAKTATRLRFGNVSDNSDESDKISGESKEDDSEKISEEGKDDKSEKKSEEGKEDKEEESDDKSGNSSDGPSDGDESEEESNVKSDDDKSGNSSESEEEDKHNEGKDKTDYVEEEEEEEEEEEKEEDKFEDGEYFQQEAIPPKMYFQPSEYNSPIKLSGRCYIEKAVRKLKEILNPSELKWFETHPQFRHFFHMYLEDNHKAMGMWMLLLHTVSSSKKKECWFVVNGVPIRYSLREVALISGLNCQSYPHNYLSLGGDSAKFVEKYFGKGNKGGSGKPKKVTLKDVDEKLE